MKQTFLTIGRVFSRIEDILLAVLLGVLILLSVWQIVQRNLWGNGFVWTDELLRILVLWLTMVGAMIASRNDNHIRMDLLVNKLPEVLRIPIKRIVFLATFLICCILARAAADFVYMEAEYSSLLLGHYPAWWFQSILPIGFFLIAWRYLLLAIWPDSVDDSTQSC